MASLFSKALDFALTKASKDSNFKLKTEQKLIVEAVVCQKKDVLAVLPTGFGKSLVFHLLSDVFDLLDSEGPPARKYIVLVLWLI